MFLLAALAVLINIGEIVAFAALFSAMVESIPLPASVRILAISGGATLSAWLCPLEHLLGTTMESGLFEPWSLAWTIGFWLLVGVGTAGILAWRR